MEQTTGNPSRKKFIFWGAAILSSFAFLKFRGFAKKEKRKTVTMLTQDGKLVEIDRSIIAARGKKIENRELQEWIKK